MSTADAQPAASMVAVNQEQRDTVYRALKKARIAAHGPGEFVGQESFMQASEILHLAQRARIGPTTSVLDLCCGIGGAGLLIARQLGCSYHGVDVSRSAVRIARARTGSLNCRFDVARVPPLPPGRFDVVLLLETLLAFRDKSTLLGSVCDALPIGGRFVLTLEAGDPLTEAERTRMPDADTVWLDSLATVHSWLGAAGLRVIWQEDCTRSHHEVAHRLHDEFVADARNISAHIGADGLQSLLTAHQLWADWLRRGRVRKIALVTEKQA